MLFYFADLYLAVHLFTCKISCFSLKKLLSYDNSNVLTGVDSRAGHYHSHLTNIFTKYLHSANILLVSETFAFRKRVCYSTTVSRRFNKELSFLRALIF